MVITAYIGIGANLGDARDTVAQAIAALACLPQTQLTAQSSQFQSAPIDAGGDDYVNAVAQLATTLSGQQLLQHLQQVELAFGRERPYQNAPRTLDLDLLLFGDQHIASATLTVPHPRMTARAFVLLPLLQIAPAVQIPGLGEASQFLPQLAGQTIRALSSA